MATVFEQPKSTYSDTSNQVRVISDSIFLIDPVDTPLTVALGGFNAARSKFKLNLNGKKIEILEDEYAATAGAVSGATITTNATNFTVADASIFQDGHVILVTNELMVVKAADTTNNTVTVYARDYGGTNSTHVSTATIEIVSMARLEGDDTDYVGLNALSNPYNICGIFQKGLKVTGSEEVMDEYGYDNAFAYQANKGVPELSVLIERMLFYGVRDAGDASSPRSSGGIDTFIGSNTVAAGGAIAKSHIDSLAEYVRKDGGQPDLFVASVEVCNDLRTLLDSSSFVRVSQEENMLGMDAIQGIRTQYGTLRLVEDRWCPVAKCYMLDSRKIGLYELRPFQWEPLGKTGDSRKAELIWEGSVLVANNEAHGTITGVTS